MNEACGETGIRTLGPPKADNGFRDRPIQPLWHLSLEGARLHIQSENRKRNYSKILYLDKENELPEYTFLIHLCLHQYHNFQKH